MHIAVGEYVWLVGGRLRIMSALGLFLKCHQTITMLWLPYHLTQKTLAYDCKLYTSVQYWRLNYRYNHCFRRVDDSVRYILFFEPSGTFQSGGHTCMSYIKTLLRDSNLHSVNDLSQAMASRDE